MRFQGVLLEWLNTQGNYDKWKGASSQVGATEKLAFTSHLLKSNCVALENL